MDALGADLLGEPLQAAEAGGSPARQLEPAEPIDDLTSNLLAATTDVMRPRSGDVPAPMAIAIDSGSASAPGTGVTRPTIPLTTTATPPDREKGLAQGRAPRTGDRHVPDWARDWHASIEPSGSVQEEVCSLYSEWLHLVQKTRGGMFFGSDPSYGGELSARNQRGPSYSFYDNTRYVTLSKLFGRGFIPIGCP